ncbi:tetraspanin-7-like [Argiope bruennichi]|uniref:Tetraspanin n=1 Tax=Argiope bruennichi TaxID=94029 RepID=A0A8T0FM05_ARGBR|nr:tetraspanin-7-like [Argiope bruennichi]KAF8792237.1 Tetraspanin-7 like protein [Argiope bruennichi]
MTRRLQTVAAVTCMKLLLLIFNVIFWAAGVVLLFFGLWMKISFHYLFELSDEYQEVIPYIFIGAGSIILIVGFFSCCCIVKGQPALLYILAVFLSIVFLCEITAGISGYIYRGKIQDGFKTGLNSSIAQYGDGRIRDRDVDMVQKYLKCCGVQDYADWYSKWSNHSVPESCCVNKATCHYSPVVDTTEIYTEGCYVKVVDFVNSNLGALLGGACGLAGLQLIGVILACCLAKYADKAKYEPVN